ncbi:MAG: ATP synthase F1 subunit epsilon [Bacilli bacterium]|nr:ATP synthase F1 subunit epsilon [Bacilli bacterium]
MKKFFLEINTPKGSYFKGEVEEVYLKTSNGYMGIMANHESLITCVEIAPGFILNDGKRSFYAFFSGVLHIDKDGVKLILSNVESAESIDESRAKTAREKALERLKDKKEEIDIKRAELALKRALARLGTINRDFL